MKLPMDVPDIVKKKPSEPKQKGSRKQITAGVSYIIRLEHPQSHRPGFLQTQSMRGIYAPREVLGSIHSFGIVELPSKWRILRNDSAFIRRRGGLRTSLDINSCGTGKSRRSNLIPANYPTKKQSIPAT